MGTVMWEHSGAMSGTNGLRYAEFYCADTDANLHSHFAQPNADSSIPTFNILNHSSFLVAGNTIEIRVWNHNAGADTQIVAQDKGLVNFGGAAISPNQTTFKIFRCVEL